MKNYSFTTIIILSLCLSTSLFSSDVEETTPTDNTVITPKVVMCKFNKQASAEDTDDKKPIDNCEAPSDYSINDREYFIPQE